MLCIIIVTYNSAETIGACLTSIVLSRLAEPVRIIVIDNHSSDGTCAIIKNWHEKDLHLIINKQNVGFAKAVNQGLTAAASHTDTQYFLLLNPDASLHPDALSRMIEHSRQHPRIGLLSPLVLSANDHIPWFSGGRIHWLSQRTTHESIPSSPVNLPTPTYYLTPTTYLTGCCLLLTRPLYDTIGGLDERYFLYYEDVDYSHRTLAAGYQGTIVPEAVCYHKESHSSDAPTKTYYLVKSGLHFFAQHTPLVLRPYFWLTVLMRWVYHSLISGKKIVARGIHAFWVEYSALHQ